MKKKAWLLLVTCFVLSLLVGFALEHYKNKKILHDIQSQIPPLNGTAWLNSKPLSPASLKGKVVLIDFWDYTCVNCLRTFPYLKDWYSRYHKDGFVIIGVHTPEFNFAKKERNVSAAVKKFGLKYPIVLDNEYRIWNAFHNEYWPRDYLFNAEGKLCYTHIGEGDYGRAEKQIQICLHKLHPDLKLPKPLQPLTPEEMPGAVCYPMTPELYVGYQRGDIGNPQGYEQGKVVDYQDPYCHNPHDYIDGIVYAQGDWRDQRQDMLHARRTKRLEDYILIKYHAITVNAVIRSADRKKFLVYVFQDGKPVPVKDKGSDLRYDKKGRSYLLISQPRMYRVIHNQKYGSHLLKFASDSPSFALYSFTFGACTVPEK